MKTDRKLDYAKIIETIDNLEIRIGERFPESGLRSVCQNFLEIARETGIKIQWISKPNYWLRMAVYFFILVGITGIIYSFSTIELKSQKFTITDLITMSEAALNDVVLIGAAIFFLITMETRIKRSRAIEMLNELRGIAHIVDMHQLTKDPIIINGMRTNTEHSPKRSFNRFELERYLTYCSEFLSLIGKVAALYSQSLPDDVVASNVNEIESMSDGVSRKIWQKLSILSDYDNDSDLAYGSERELPTDLSETTDE